jgi:hypothetical protein
MRNFYTSSPNWQASGENWIHSDGGTPIASTTNGIGRTSNIAIKNRDLIVKAVNEHAALVAVAEAAKVLLENTFGNFSANEMKVLKSLTNLAEVRNGK